MTEWNISTINSYTESTIYDVTDFIMTSERHHCVGDNDTIHNDTYTRTGHGYASTMLMVSFVSVFCVYATLGNFAVIFIIFTDKYLKKVKQNMYLASMAFADALLCLFIIPFSLSQELLGTWQFGAVYCRIYLATDVLLCTASIWSICVIGLDRYWSVCRPLANRKKRTRKTIKLVVLSVWIGSLVISIPPVFSKSNHIPTTSEEACSLNDDTWYIIFSSLSSFFIPALIIVPVYTNIYLVGRRHARGKVGEAFKSNSNCHGNGNSFNSKSEGAVYRLDSRQSSLRGKSFNAHNLSVGKYPMINENEQSDFNENIENYKLTNGGVASSTFIFEKNDDATMSNLLSPTNGLNSKRKTRTSTTSNISFQSIKFVFKKNKFVRKWSDCKLPHVGARERRFTFIIFIVMGCFMICWFPFFQTYVIYAICREKCCINKSMFKAFFWLGYMNSGFNPALYTIFNKEFRNGFRRMFKRLNPFNKWRK